MARAVVIRATGGPDVLGFEERDAGPPGVGAIRVRIHAVGVNFIDVYFRTGLYPAPLPFVLLSDHGGTVRRAYGVPATLGILPGRVTFVVDRQGVVRHVFNSQLQATQHVREAIGALRELHGA